MLIKANQEKFYVSVSVSNSKDNAYNTKVGLVYSENINYVKVEVSSFFTTFCTIAKTRNMECCHICLT